MTSQVKVDSIVPNTAASVSMGPVALSGGTISGITDLAVEDGGTGASTPAAALVNLGITATAAELNTMDGVTASTAELNLLDGVTTSTAELNFVDGVTSAIQPQLDQKPTLATEIVTTSGTSHDFTGIPSWVKRITVMFDRVSMNSVDSVCIQLGDAGGIETSGYIATNCQIQNGSGVLGSESSTAFSLTQGGNALEQYSGSIVLVLENPSTNVWISSGILRFSGSSSNSMVLSAGRKPLSATLDRIRITSGAGAATFDNGAVNILYE